MKHTQGEWKVDMETLSVVAENGLDIANCGFLNYYSVPECEANAKLIAAAPELLQACISAINCLSSTHPHKNITEEKIREAIKKATE